MQEQRRQTYLSLLGIEGYIPRWELAGAKVSELYHSEVYNADQELKLVGSIFNELTAAKELAAVKDIFSQEKPLVKPIAQLIPDLKTQPVSVQPFALSVWRFDSGLMIIDSRDTQQALPTDLLLQNFIGVLTKTNKLPPVEIIRWPLVENRFTRLTTQDAREEMRAWLSVQQDIRSLKCLWLMGALAAKNLLPDGENYEHLLYSDKTLSTDNLSILISESLNELLINPLHKKHLLKFYKLFSPMFSI